MREQALLAMMPRRLHGAALPIACAQRANAGTYSRTFAGLGQRLLAELELRLQPTRGLSKRCAPSHRKDA